MLNNPLYKELQKSFLLLVVCLLVSAGVVFGLLSHNESRKLYRTIDSHVRSVELDLQKMQYLYSRQLQYIASHLRTIIDKPQSIKRFFDSDDSLILDRAAIHSILVTDSTGKIIYNNITSKSLKQGTVKHRKYFVNIRSTPNQVVLGQVVQGLISKKPALPVSIGISDAEGNFRGGLIFGVALDNIAQNLKYSVLEKIHLNNIEQCLDATALFNGSLYQFLRVILSNFSGNYVHRIYDVNTNQCIELTYNTRIIQQDLLFEFVAYILLLVIILGSIFIFYYYRIIRPLYPAFHSLKLISNHSLQSGNLYTAISTGVQEQQQLLELQKQDHALQVQKLAMLINSLGSLGGYVQNKLEILAEDIASESTQKIAKDKVSAKNLERIQELAVDSSEEVIEIVKAFFGASIVLQTQQKSNYNLSDLITKLSDDYPVEVQENFIDKVILFYTAPLELLLNEIKKCSDIGIGEPTCIISSTEGIRFIFDINKQFEVSLHKQFALCKLWAMLNDIEIRLVYNTRFEIILVI